MMASNRNFGTTLFGLYNLKDASSWSHLFTNSAKQFRVSATKVSGKIELLGNKLSCVLLLRRNVVCAQMNSLRAFRNQARILKECVKLEFFGIFAMKSL